MPEVTPPDILGLLGDPVRWRLVAELGRSDRRVGELVRLVGKPQNLVSYHLGELRDAGIVTSRRSSADGRDVYYRADLLRCGQLLGEASGSLHAGLAPRLTPTEPGPSHRSRPRVLFLCTGNSARSQMAEAIVEHRSAGRVDACSAGSHPKPLHPDAVRVMAERGIDIADRPTKPLTRFTRRRFDRIVTLCDKVREVCPEFPGAPVTAHWSIADPAQSSQGMTAFRETAEELDTRIILLLADLAEPTPGGTHRG